MGNSSGSASNNPDKDVIVEYLKVNPVFEGESKKRLGVVADYFELKNFKKGEYLIKKGDHGDSLFVIAEGVVNFTLPGEDNTETSIRTMHAGELFGEFALVYNTQRTASALADSDEVKVLVLTREKYTEAKKSKYMEPLESRVQLICQLLVNDGLKQIPFLEDVPEETLGLVAHLFRFEEVSSQTTIFTEGDVGDRFYIVFEGELVVTIRDDLGFVLELTRLKPGMNFGDKSLLANVKRSATVTTVTDCQLFSLGKEDFQKFRNAVPDINEDMIERMTTFTYASRISKNVPIFRSMTKKGEQLLGLLSSHENIKPKTNIITQGHDTPRNLYIILKGSVDVYVDDEYVRSLNPGEYFGEVLLVSNQTSHSATVQTKANSGCTALVIQQESFKQLFVDEPTIFAEIQLRVLGANAKLSTILRYPKALDSFLRHCQAEFAQENVDFWEAVTRLEDLGNRKTRKATLRAMKEDIAAVIDKKAKMLKDSANMIFNRFVKPESVAEVNLSSPIRKSLIAKIENEEYDYNMFADARSEIYGMMEADNFSRYIVSDEFKALLEEVGQYK